LNHRHLVSLAFNDLVRANLHEILSHPSPFGESIFAIVEFYEIHIRLDLSKLLNVLLGAGEDGIREFEELWVREI
jgi:hypothetical protein